MSIKSIILLCFQFLSMGYLVSKFLIGSNLVINSVQFISIGIVVWGIIAGGLTKFNMQPEVKSETLITNGPFKLIRNPMYTGILLFFGTTLLYNSSVPIWIAYVILTITLLLKIYSEERFLESKFGEQYRVYKKNTFRLIPYVF